MHGSCQSAQNRRRPNCTHADRKILFHTTPLEAPTSVSHCRTLCSSPVKDVHCYRGSLPKSEHQQNHVCTCVCSSCIASFPFCISRSVSCGLGSLTTLQCSELHERRRRRPQRCRNEVAASYRTDSTLHLRLASQFMSRTVESSEHEAAYAGQSVFDEPLQIKLYSLHGRKTRHCHNPIEHIQSTQPPEHIDR